MDKTYLEKVTDANRLAFINLFNLYHHDLAEYIPDFYQTLDEEGYYDRGAVLEILEMPPNEVQPYIIRHMDKIAGLVVLTFPPYVKPGCDYCILEIFVANSHRGKGIARAACRILFNEFPGRYCIQVLQSNTLALAYWDSLIAREGRLIQRYNDKESLITYEFEVKVCQQ